MNVRTPQYIYILTSTLEMVLNFEPFTIDTIPYDTGLEAPFAHSLHTVYFRKFTPCLLPRLTFEPEPLRQVGKFRPTKLN